MQPIRLISPFHPLRCQRRQKSHQFKKIATALGCSLLCMSPVMCRFSAADDDGSNPTLGLGPARQLSGG